MGLKMDLKKQKNLEIKKSTKKNSIRLNKLFH